LGSLLKQALTLRSGARDLQRCEGSGQSILVKAFMLDSALVTGQRLEGAISIGEPPIIRGHRISGHAIDPGK
jgi:hypothetical protein